MSVATNRQGTGVIIIGGVPFFLAKNEKGVPTWQTRQVQTQEGDPATPRRRRLNDWSRGMGDSRGVFRGTVEYAEYAYLQAMGRILPAPLITEIATGHSAAVKDIVEVTLPANRIISLGGTTAKEINPATHAVATTGSLSGSALSGQLFSDQLAIAVGDTTAYWIRNSAGAYAQNSITKYARAFGLSGPDLVRGFGNTWSKCSAANITSVNNWSTEYALGNKAGLVNQVFSHNRWDYVLKDEGLYTFDVDTSEESNVLGDLEAFRSPENRTYGKWYSNVFICSLAGLYRFIQQGAARTVGIEEVALNEGELSGVYPTAFAAFGRQFYVAYLNPATGVTYICLGRRAMDGDSGMDSPFTITSVIDKFSGECRAMHISALPTVTELFYGAGVNVRYFPITRDGLPASYQTTNTAIIRFAPTDFDSPMTVKQFRGIEVYGKNAGASQAITWKASMDGATAAAIGTAITAFSTRYAERFWVNGVSDVGRTMQLIAEMTTGGSSSAPVEIRDVVVNYEERPVMVPGAVVGLRFRDFDSEGDVSSRLTAKESRELLESYLDGPVVDITDPWGDTYAARIGGSTYSSRIGGYQGEVKEQYRGEEPQVDVSVTIRKLAYS